MASLFQPEGFKLDPSSPFYTTPEERLAQKTAWDKYKGSDLTNFYASDPDLMQMQDRTAQAIQRENAKPLRTPTGPGAGAQAGAVNEMRLAGVNDPYSSDNKDALRVLTSSIKKNGYQQTVDDRGPVSQFMAANPEFLPDNNTQGTPYLPAGGTGNTTETLLEQLNNDLVANNFSFPQTGEANTAPQQAAQQAASSGLTIDDINKWYETKIGGQSNQTDKFDQFKEFMGLLSGMGGMFGGGGVPGFASGGVAAASPYNNFMGFMNAFKSLGGGSQRADITTGNIN